jgi:hypothetical protein
MKMYWRNCREVEAEHRRNQRSYAHTYHYPNTVCLADAFWDLPKDHQEGLLLHEAGHLLAGPSGTEEDANQAAEEVFGGRIEYVDSPYGEDLERAANPSVSDLVDARRHGYQRGQEIYRSTGVHPSTIAADSVNRDFGIWWEYGGQEALGEYLSKAEAKREWVKGFRGKYGQNPGAAKFYLDPLDAINDGVDPEPIYVMPKYAEAHSTISRNDKITDGYAQRGSPSVKYGRKIYPVLRRPYESGVNWVKAIFV